MELTAVIKALEALKEPCEVTLTTDSKYVCDAVNKGWLLELRVADVAHANLVVDVVGKGDNAIRSVVVINGTWC